MITLFPDQAEAATAIRGAFGQGRRSILFVAPCGFGKTVLFSYIAHGAMRRGKSVLILTHRGELIDQISRALTAQNVPHGFIQAGKPYDHKPVMVASIQTMVRRLNHHSIGYALIVIDEAHHCTKLNSFGTVLNAFGASKLLGVTATPCRLSGEGLGDIFEQMILGPDTQSLIDVGRLSPFKLYVPPGVDTGGLKIYLGDYRTRDTTALMNKPTITGDAITHYRKYADGTQFVAFCTSVVHAQAVAEQFSQSGIDTRCVHGGMNDEERTDAIGAFRAGALRGLCSVDLISEGFDVPSIGCGIMLRPTASRSLFYQTFGRCLRSASGKAHAVILDHVGNVRKHGLPTEEQNWRLEETKGRGKKEAAKVSVRVCPTCYAAMPGGTSICTECRYEWPIESRTVKQVDGELTEWVSRQPSPETLEVWKARTLEQLQEIGRRRGYSPYWAYVRYKARRLGK